MPCLRILLSFSFVFILVLFSVTRGQKIFEICKFLDTENEVFCKFICICRKKVVTLQPESFFCYPYDNYIYMQESIYRILKMLVVLWMSFLGTAVFAAEEPLIMLFIGTEGANVDTTYYTSFPDALKIANKSPQASMVLLGDVGFGGKAASQAVKTNLTIDLNGYTIGDTLKSTSLFSLGVDTLTLHITSSRSGGRIAVNRDYNGRIYAISCSKGQLFLDHITIEAHNTAVYDADTSANVAVTAVTIGARASIEMNECRVYASAYGSVTAINGSGTSSSAAHMDLRSCYMQADGLLRVYGINSYSTVSVKDCEVEVNASTNPAYGIMVRNMYDSVKMQDIRGFIENTRVRVSSLKQAYGIYSYAPLTVSNDSIRTMTERESSYALYATKDLALFTLYRSQFIAKAGAATAYGAYLQKGNIEAGDCLFSGTAHQDTAHVAAESGARGIVAGAHCDVTMRHCTVQATGTNQDAARGVCAVSVDKTSRLTIRGCDIAAQGAENTTALRGSGKTAYGINCYNTTYLSDCAIEVSATANSAYGVFIYHRNDSTPSPIPTEMHRIRLAVSALKQVYGIYTRTNTIFSDDTVSVKTDCESATGLYIYSDTVVCSASRCSFVAEAGYQSAYGVNIYRGHFRAEDCFFSATARQDTVLNQPAESYVRTISSGVNGSLVLNRCKVSAKGTNSTNAKGVYAVFADKSSRLALRGSVMQAESAVLACAVRGMAAGTIDSCTLTANAKRSEAYALYTATSEDSILVHNCRLKSEAPEKNNFIYKNSNMQGRIYFDHGYYSHDTNLRMYLPEGYGLYRLYEGEEYQSGYRYTIQPVDHPDAVVARMYDTRTGAHMGDYKRVADALWYANFHDERELTIVIVADCQLDWSTYIVPKHTTLVIGYKEGQNSAIGTKALRSYTTSRKRQRFAQLELLDNAELIVEGILEVSGVQQSESRICGTVSGEFGYGQMHLAPTASVVLEAEARLQAWGYITGTGTITAKAGAYVYEFLQLGDWKGGTVTYEMVNNRYKVFPMTHFFYQNIECPLVYHAGSKAFGSTMISVSSYSSTHDDIRLLDDKDALFSFSENAKNATIRKEYDPKSDRIIWTTNGDISLDQLGLYLNFGTEEKYSLVSSQYVLPLGTNMTIRALSGSLEMKHDVVMLPGSKVEIAPDARLHIPENVRLYLYDTDEWGWYGTEEDGYATVTYSPSWEVCPRDTVLADARMEIGGSALVDGALYTTEGGAAIVGTDSGRIIFTQGALPDDAVYQFTGTHDAHQYTASVATMPALLNADSTRTPAKKALQGAVYNYMNGVWFSADTIVDIIPDTTDTIPVDTLEGLTIPHYSRQRKLILRNGTIYILTPDGGCYTLLGLPERKEEIQ